MRSIINTLPVAWQDKAKAIVGALGAVLTAVAAVLQAQGTTPLWLTVVLAALSALGVYGAVNPGYVSPPVRKDRALGESINHDGHP